MNCLGFYGCLCQFSGWCRGNQFTTLAIIFISSTFPLLLGDDSNTFVFQEKKRGGNAYDSQKIAGFQDFIASALLALLGNPTGDVLIITYWRLSILTQYLMWFDKLFTSTGEIHFIRNRKIIQNKYFEEENYIHSNSTPSSPYCTCSSSLSLLVSHILHSLSLSLLSSDAFIIDFNGKLLQYIFQHGGNKKAIKYGINHAIICASNLYQVGDEISHLYKWKWGIYQKIAIS